MVVRGVLTVEVFEPLIQSGPRFFQEGHGCNPGAPGTAGTRGQLGVQSSITAE